MSVALVVDILAAYSEDSYDFTCDFSVHSLRDECPDQSLNVAGSAEADGICLSIG